jgi:hypothetical protein
LIADAIKSSALTIGVGLAGLPAVLEGDAKTVFCERGAITVLVAGARFEVANLQAALSGDASGAVRVGIADTELGCLVASIAKSVRIFLAMSSFQTVSAGVVLRLQASDGRS